MMAPAPHDRSGWLLRVILVAAAALAPVSFQVDDLVSQALVAWRPPGVEVAGQILTRLGDGVLNIGLPCVLGLIGWWRGQRALCVRGWLGGATVAGAGLVQLLLKHAACRARPSAAGAGAFFTGFPCVPAEYAVGSFPSGHATTAFALATLLALWYPRWAIGFLGLAVGVGFTRVLLGVHFPSDVLAGAALGMGAALIVHAKVPGVRRSRQAVNPDAVHGGGRG
jgi:undecaprenyl-diphosphatase